MYILLELSLFCMLFYGYQIRFAESNKTHAQAKWYMMEIN